MLGLGLGLPKIGNKIVKILRHLKSYWHKNSHQWNHENTNWNTI